MTITSASVPSTPAAIPTAVFHPRYTALQDRTQPRTCMFYCYGCKRWHRHGAIGLDGFALGHRVAHCPGDAPGRYRDGYVISRILPASKTAKAFNAQRELLKEQNDLEHHHYVTTHLLLQEWLPVNGSTTAYVWQANHDDSAQVELIADGWRYYADSSFYDDDGHFRRVSLGRGTGFKTWTDAAVEAINDLTGNPPEFGPLGEVTLAADGRLPAAA